jgi:hypothetical protein
MFFIWLFLKNNRFVLLLLNFLNALEKLTLDFKIKEEEHIKEEHIKEEEIKEEDIENYGWFVTGTNTPENKNFI